VRRAENLPVNYIRREAHAICAEALALALRAVPKNVGR
jgi:hypothetical protein